TGGTGLGLSIVKHVALNHGGDVKVWSQIGVGSTFSIILPIATQEELSEDEQ
ncbi:MAG: ATP-binding protein, partial [Candidatus Nanopelagicaceae bacterium]